MTVEPPDAIRDPDISTSPPNADAPLSDPVIEPFDPETKKDTSVNPLGSGSEPLAFLVPESIITWDPYDDETRLKPGL